MKLKCEDNYAEFLDAYTRAHRRREQWAQFRRGLADGFAVGLYIGAVVCMVLTVNGIN